MAGSYTEMTGSTMPKWPCAINQKTGSNIIKFLLVRGNFKCCNNYLCIDIEYIVSYIRLHAILFNHIK